MFLAIFKPAGHADIDRNRVAALLAGNRQREDDAGVTQRKEETDPQRALPVAQQLAGGVVDGGDVIGVEGVPQARA